ncbi:MAG: MFS transporter [Pseudomonadota bacterium]|nr:MFS transporter [Pseudomonadota bacterium]
MGILAPMRLVFIIRIFLPFAAGYYISYTFRTINAVMAPELARDIGIDAAGLGLLTSVYLLTFAAFQIPLGILLDRYGPKMTQVVLLMFAVAGSVIFALSENTGGLILGRALIGFGVSGCLMAAFKAFVLWFPRTHLPLANGVIFMIGGIGAMSSTAPVEAALGITDWRGVFLLLAGLTAGTAVMVMVMVPPRPARADETRNSLAADIAGISAVVRHPRFLRFAPVSVLCSGMLMSHLGLWAGPWLRDTGGLSRDAAADVLFMAFGAMTISYFSTGWLAARAQTHGIAVEKLSVIGMCLFMAVQSLIALDFGAGAGYWPATLWILFATFGTTGSLIYASLASAFPPELAGRVNTTLNLLVFIAAFAAQWGIGVIINSWPEAAPGRFAAESYEAAFWTMLAVQFVGLFWLIVMPLFQRRGQVT